MSCFFPTHYARVLAVLGDDDPLRVLALEDGPDLSESLTDVDLDVLRHRNINNVHGPICRLDAPGIESAGAVAVAGTPPAGERLCRLPTERRACTTPSSLDKDGVLVGRTPFDTLREAAWDAFVSLGIEDPDLAHVDDIAIGVDPATLTDICERYGLDPVEFWRVRDEDFHRSRAGRRGSEGRKTPYDDVDALPPSRRLARGRLLEPAGNRRRGPRPLRALRAVRGRIRP